MNTLLPWDRGYQQDPQYRELPKDIGGYQHIDLRSEIVGRNDILVSHGFVTGFCHGHEGLTVQEVERDTLQRVYRKMPQPCNHQPDVIRVLQGHGLKPTGILAIHTGTGPLPEDPSARKHIPIATGFIDYFPRAVAAVAHISHVGNEQHNPGTPLHWDRSKSGDEADALMRHFVERGTIDQKDGCRHSAKMAWRAMALLEKELENSDKKPLAGHELCG